MRTAAGIAVMLFVAVALMAATRTKPTPQLGLSVNESVGMVTAVRLRQSITTVTDTVLVTVKNPSSLTNSDSVGHTVWFKCVDDTAFYKEWFAAGQEKARRVTVVGGTTAGNVAGWTLIVSTRD